MARRLTPDVVLFVVRDVVDAKSGCLTDAETFTGTTFALIGNEIMTQLRSWEASDDDADT